MLHDMGPTRRQTLLAILNSCLDWFCPCTHSATKGFTSNLQSSSVCPLPSCPSACLTFRPSISACLRLYRSVCLSGNHVAGLSVLLSPTWGCPGTVCPRLTISPKHLLSHARTPGEQWRGALPCVGCRGIIALYPLRQLWHVLTMSNVRLSLLIS